MRRAGEAVARLAERMTRSGELILFLAGKGHNGDDAAYACDFVRERERLLSRVIDPEISAAEFEGHLARRPALLVDGLFGVGLNRPLSGVWMSLIERINRAGLPTLSVDVPSGLSADTGLPLDVAIRATTTLTFGAVKHGLLKSTAAPFVGRLEVATEIGLTPYPFDTELSLSLPGDFKHFPPARMAAGHKGTFGHLAILAGSAGYHGAAVLAARGAQRAQPGLITVCPHADVYLPIASQLQAAMVKPWSSEPELPDTCTGVLVGPGLAAKNLEEPFHRMVRRLWQDSPLPVIVDASALAWLPPGPCEEHALRAITPHPGEAARMLQWTTTDVQRDRIRAARELSRRWGNCHAVLKGHQTVILQGRGEATVNNSGNPHLAQGGSGDLLAGFLGGLWAQPELQKQAGRALRYGVWQHGAAADCLLSAKPAFTIEDLAAVLGDVRPCN